jgi:hypothetical protein
MQTWSSHGGTGSYYVSDMWCTEDEVATAARKRQKGALP